MRRGDTHEALAPPPRRAGLLLALLASTLAGCAEVHHGVEAVGRVGAPAPVAEAPPPGPPVKVVRAGRAAPAGEEVADLGRPAGAALPSPREIFDFHPAGTPPDSWRQPFVIDTSDGPLAADVRRSAAELRDFLAQQKAGGAGAAGRTAKRGCSETDVARHLPGCGDAPGRPEARAAAAPAPTP